MTCGKSRLVSGRGLACRLLVVFILAASGCAKKPEIPTALVETKIKRLGLAPGAPPRALSISDNGHRLAYASEREGKWAVVCDGQTGPLYENVFWLEFAPRGVHFAYAAIRSGKQFMVIDGREGPPCDEVKFPKFSPDGRHVAYVGRRGEPGGNWHVFFDGVEGPPWREVQSDYFHRLTGEYTFIGRRDGKSFIFRDGPSPAEGGKEWLAVGSPSSGLNFSPDGRRLAYVTKRDGKSFVVVDGKEHVLYSGETYLWFSPDGGHIAWDDRRDGKAFIVLDGDEGPAYDRVHSPVFSPDGKRIAYIADRGDMSFMVCDGKEGPPVTPKEIRDVSQVDESVFSHDSRHFAYRIGRHKRWSIVRDGKITSGAYDWVYGLAFSPDGKHLFCAGCRDSSRWFPVCNEMEGEAMDGQGHVLFSKDSRHLVTFEEHKGLIACDGIRGPRHAWLRWLWDENKESGRMRYVAGDGKDAWLIEAEYPAGLDWSNGLKPAKTEVP